MLRLSILPVLGLIAAVGFACGDSGDDKTQTGSPAAPVPTATLPTSTPVSTGWQTYSSADYGFSFQYPAGWYLDVHGSHPDTTMDYVAVSNFDTHQGATATFLPGTIRFEFYIGDRNGLSLEGWVAGNRAELGTGSVKVVTSEPLVIDGNQGLEQTASYYCCDASSDTPLIGDFFVIGNFVLLIGGPSIDSPNLPLYRQILQSLRFGESTSTASPTATTLTYSDPTHTFTFDYPASWHLSPAEDNGGDAILYSYDPAANVGDGRPVPPDKLKVFFWIAAGVDKPLAQWLAEGHSGPGEVSPPTIISQSDTTLGGKPGLNEVIESDGIQDTSYYIPIDGERVFVVNAGPADSELWPEFEPVLASVRFAP